MANTNDYLELRDWLNSLEPELRKVVKSPRFVFEEGDGSAAECFVSLNERTIKYSISKLRSNSLKATLFINGNKQYTCTLLRSVNKGNLELAKNLILNFAGNEL